MLNRFIFMIRIMRINPSNDIISLSAKINSCEPNPICFAANLYTQNALQIFSQGDRCSPGFFDIHWKFHI